VKQIFINLSVNDLEKSAQLYTALDFTINSLFTFHDQICMVWSEHIFVMLQSNFFFNTGTNTGVRDINNYSAPSFTLPVESVERMNEIVQKGLNAGGKETTPLIDEGFMQVRTIEDFDGHKWGLIYLDVEDFRNKKNK